MPWHPIYTCMLCVCWVFWFCGAVVFCFLCLFCVVGVLCLLWLVVVVFLGGVSLGNLPSIEAALAL